MPLVKNINGTANRPVPNGYSSFEEFWLRTTGHRSLEMCRCCGERPAEVGGHVIKVNSFDNSWYITPLCKACNHPSNKDSFFVYEEDLAKLHQ